MTGEARASRRGELRKPKAIWVVISSDVRFATERAWFHTKQDALEFFRRRQSGYAAVTVPVKFIEAPVKPRARTAANALKNFDKTFGSIPEMRKRPSARKR